MSKERADIPILGLDTRPLERQARPGLCSDIKNLRPHGPKKEPYWKAVAEPGQLKNSSGNRFSHGKQELIVDAFLQTKDHNVPDGAKQRLILVFADGSLDIIDPEKDWEVLTTYDFEDEGVWTAECAELGELVAIALTKDDLPYRLIYIYDDTVFPYGFPMLPSLTMEPDPVSFLDEEIEAGTHTGLRDGYYAWRYGFRINGYHTVALSPPIPFEVVGDENTFAELEFNLGGYVATNLPEGFSFWEKMLSGIDVFVSDRHESKHEVLLNGLFYNMLSFPSINYKEDYKGEDPNIKRFTGRNDTLTAHPLAEIQSPHRLAANTIHTFNSQLVMGRVAVDFVIPMESILGNVAQGITMTPVERRVNTNYIRGSDYETYSVYTYTFSLIVSGTAVLPESAVSVGTIGRGGEPATGSVFIEQDGDKKVNVRVRDDMSLALHGYDYVRVEAIDVSAQAYTDMSAEEPVGGAFRYHGLNWRN